MNTILNLQKEINYFFFEKKEKESNFFGFPHDVLKLMLSHMDYSSLQSTSCVSHFWNGITIETTRAEQFVKIKKLSEYLGVNLQQTHLDKSHELLEIGENDTILNSAHLPAFKGASQEYLDRMIDILKHLDINDLALLETDSKQCVKPAFFDPLFDLSKIYSIIERAYLGREEKYKRHFLALKLLENGHMDRAFAVAFNKNRQISSDYNFLVISGKLAELGQFLNAAQAANRILEKNTLTLARRKIIFYCFQLKNLFNSEAWEVAFNIYQLKFPCTS